MSRPNKYDWGTRFEITIKNQAGTVVDISGASLKRIVFEDPNNGVSSAAATFTTDGTDGKMYWDSSTSFLTIHGRWKMQGKYGDANQLNRTSVTFFYVQEVLE